ncbi:MAG: acyl carrier protein [Pseudomonadota bacterium]
MADEVRATVHRIVAEQAMIDVADVSDDMTPEDLGIDSMGLVEAIFAIEEAFDIQVPFNANAPRESGFDVTDVGGIVAAVRRLVDARRA